MVTKIGNGDKHAYLKHKIGVSGAAEMGFLGESAYETAKELGRIIADAGAVTVTGATTGFPLWVAMGAKQAKGVSVGFSPASSEREHVQVYKLPLDYMDYITYTGFGYTGRDLLFTRSSDAIIIGPGRIGTIHEFTIAYEDQKPIGVLQGTGGKWETDQVIKLIMEKSHRVNNKVIFDEDPKRLVARLIEMIDEDRTKHLNVYKNDDYIGGSTGDVIL
ncbi:MAG: hypothetical protein RL094_219 [Candidatus Parcubacteria bacterium]|jgi:uncharacterized protein (TIGR00725 family)